MKVGLLIEVEEGLDWDHWRSTYTSAERLGFDSIWLSDHLDSAWSTRPGLETWTALAVAAAETRRITLGSLVSPVTFREPAILARMATTLSALSQQRFVVGLGLGWNAEEHASAGIPFPRAHERAQRLVHSIERIRGVPVLVGGKGQTALRIAAKFASEWNVTTASAAQFHALNEQLDTYCAELGRDPRALCRSVAAGVLIGRTPGDLQARLERMRACVPPLSGLESAREMGWLVGTRAEVNAAVGALAVVGVERIMLGHYDLDDTETLEIIAEALL